MTHSDHVKLIKNAIPKSPGMWTDLGSGEGAFTLALAELLNSESKICSIDTNSLSLEPQEAEFKQRFPFFTVEFLQLDFTQKLPFLENSLDGILMANSLHFIKDKIPLLRTLKKLLKPNGRIVFIEYNVDQGNQWVPYPFSFETLKNLAKDQDSKRQYLQEQFLRIF